MKRFAKYLLLMAVFSMALAFSACGSVVSIEIEKGNEPQLNYVVGQELDLAGGKLTARSKDGKEVVPLDDPAIKVSGYDKNTAGKQELTVEYKGKTTTLSVTVSERLTPEGFSKELFVGESLDRSSGKLRVMRDDGTSFTVPLGDEHVTLSGFDSTKSGPCEVAVRYADGAADYSGSFTVTVYEIEGISFNRPNKIVYRSHESKLDLSGGYFTVTGNGGNLKRYVPLTEEMASGFDPGLATIQNKTDPLKQTVTVHYADRDFSYEISITFSNVSVILLRAEELSTLDFTDSVPVLTEEQTARAVEAAELYFALPSSDKDLIPEEELKCVMRSAAAGGRALWREEAEKYAAIFTPVNGAAQLVTASYEDAAGGIEMLSAAGDFTALGDTLLSISRAFADTVLCGNVTVGNYLGGVFGTQVLNTVVAKLGLLTKLYETLLPIPEEWTQEDLTANEQAIKDAVSYVTNSAYSSLSDRYIFGIASSWRTKHDIFDILYTYYYVMAQDRTVTNRLVRYQLPGELEPLYVAVNYATAQFSGMQHFTVRDNTLFHKYYADVQAAYAAMLARGNELQLGLYAALGLEQTIAQLRTAMMQNSQGIVIGGYFYQENAMLGDPAYTALWQDYLEIVDLTFGRDGYTGSEDYAEDVEALFHTFTDLTPARQFGFLVSLNTFYRYGDPFRALDISENVSSYFALFLADVYANRLAPAPREVFFSLLAAVEYRARFGMDTAAEASFIGAMQEVETGYAALQPAEKNAFDARLLFLLEKYRAVLRGLQTQAEIPADMQADFTALRSAMSDIYSAFGQIVQNVPVTAALLASFEKGEALVDKITSSGNEAALRAFTQGACNLFRDHPEYSWDVCWLNIRNYAVQGLTQINVTMGDSTGPIWVYYGGSGLRAFMAEAEPVLCGTGTPAKEVVLAVMKAYRELPAKERQLLVALDAGEQYYGNLGSFFDSAFATHGLASAAAKQLLLLEKACTAYQFAPSQSTLDTLSSSFAACQRAHSMLSRDETVFESMLGEVYTYYIRLCNEILG